MFNRHVQACTQVELIPVWRSASEKAGDAASCGGVRALGVVVDKRARPGALRELGHELAHVTRLIRVRARNAGHLAARVAVEPARRAEGIGGAET